MLYKWPSLVIIWLMIAGQIIYGQVMDPLKEPAPSCIKQTTTTWHNKREAAESFQTAKAFRQYRLTQDIVLIKKNITVFIP